MKSYVVVESTKVKGQRKIEGEMVELTEAEADYLLKAELIKQATPAEKKAAAESGNK